MKTLRRHLELGLLSLRCVMHRLRPKPANRDRLVRDMGRLGGMPQKIGQILATTRIATSDRAFESLTEGPGNLDEKRFEEGVRKAWPRTAHPFDSMVRRIHPGSRGASLAQVSQAELQDGRMVALKLRYPNIAYSTRTDMRLLGFLLKPLETRRQQDNLGRYRQTLATSLSRELDYERERENLEWFRSALKDDPVLSVPASLADLCTPALLVTEWATGSAVRATEAWPEYQRARAAQALVRLTIRGLVTWGRLHGDLNPGNLRFHLDEEGRAKVSLLDFGSVYELSVPERLAWTRLISSALEGRLDSTIALGCLEDIGFDRNHLEPMAAALPSVCACLLRPFLHPGPMDTRKWTLAKDLAAALGKDRMRFRQAAPPSFLMFIRAVQGLLHHLDALRAPADWLMAWGEATGRQIIARAPEGTCPSLAPQLPDLHIAVVRDGVQTFAITLPNASLDELESLVPSNALHSAEEVAKVAAEARVRRDRPGEILRHDLDGVSVRIWLGEETAVSTETALH